MKKVLFLTIFIFGFTFLFAGGDAWNQPQIDKAGAFQKLFNGETRESSEAESLRSSGSSATIYIAFGAIAIVFTVALGFIIRSKKKDSVVKKVEDTEE